MNSTQRYKKTPKGVLTILYSKMKERNVKKGFGELPFSLSELHDKFLNDTNFLVIYQKWLESNCDKASKPSFDRINPTIGYSMKNIKLMSWSENRKKADWEKSFIYTTPVVMLDENGEYIREFGSTKEASQCTGLRQSGITACCQGKYKRTGGYLFKYRGDKFRCKKTMNIHDNPELLEVE